MWTDARVRAFIVSGLRAASSRWPPKYIAKERAFRGIKTNTRTGREAKHYECAHCHGEFVSTEVDIDHIIPVVCPSEGFTTWDNYIKRLFCPTENFQTLCRPCHKIKSKKERSDKTPDPA